MPHVPSVLRSAAITIRRPGLDTVPSMRTAALARSLAAILCLMSVAGCGSNSGQSKAKLLVGTWEDLGDKGWATYHDNGIMRAEFKTGAWGILAPTEIRLAGTWEVQGDDLVIRIDRSSYNEKNVAGTVVREKLESVEKNSYSSINQQGERVNYRRVR